MMDLEGLKAWLPGRTTGFGPLDGGGRAPSAFSQTRPGVSALPLFPVTTVGSWPRPPALLRRAAAARRGPARRAASSTRSPTRRCSTSLRLQEEAGVDLVTDGEQRRDNFYSFVADKLDGVRLMTLAEMLDVVEDKAGFERILQTLDVPAYSISNPVCVGTHRARASRSPLDDLRFLQAAYRAAGQGRRCPARTC